MQVGTSQIDITPPIGVELAGFASRMQPSIGVLDRLYAKGLHLEQNGERLLWIHLDLIGVERESVLAFRDWAGRRWGLEPRQVMISATHTHSGPATIRIREAGEYDEAYVACLETHVRHAAEAAMRATEPCEVAAVEGRLDLAVDRRGHARPHTDPRVAGIGFRRADGRYVAVVTNYAMHPVALGSANRMVSADVPGRTAARLSRQLPGEPVTLVTSGACGNLNPPFENVPESQAEAWGGQVADAIANRFDERAAVERPVFRTVSRIVPLPLEALGIDEIEAYAARIVNDPVSLAQWGDRFRRAVQRWRQTMITAVGRDRAGDTRDAELLAVRIGEIGLLGVNAEVFSRFTEDVRERLQCRLYVVGYANGDLGYIPTRAAYDEGGYEVEIAHVFYGGFRPRAGGLERLAEQAAEVLRDAFAT